MAFQTDKASRSEFTTIKLKIHLIHNVIVKYKIDANFGFCVFVSGRKRYHVASINQLGQYYTAGKNLSYFMVSLANDPIITTKLYAANEEEKRDETRTVDENNTKNVF